MEEALSIDIEKEQQIRILSGIMTLEALIIMLEAFYRFVDFQFYLAPQTYKIPMIPVGADFLDEEIIEKVQSLVGKKNFSLIEEKWNQVSQSNFSQSNINFKTLLHGNVKSKGVVFKLEAYRKNIEDIVSSYSQAIQKSGELLPLDQIVVGKGKKYTLLHAIEKTRDGVFTAILGDRLPSIQAQLALLGPQYYDILSMIMSVELISRDQQDLSLLNELTKSLSQRLIFLSSHETSPLYDRETIQFSLSGNLFVASHEIKNLGKSLQKSLEFHDDCTIEEISQNIHQTLSAFDLWKKYFLDESIFPAIHQKANQDPVSDQIDLEKSRTYADAQIQKLQKWWKEKNQKYHTLKSEKIAQEKLNQWLELIKKEDQNHLKNISNPKVLKIYSKAFSDLSEILSDKAKSYSKTYVDIQGKVDSIRNRVDQEYLIPVEIDDLVEKNMMELSLSLSKKTEAIEKKIEILHQNVLTDLQSVDEVDIVDFKQPKIEEFPHLHKILSSEESIELKILDFYSKQDTQLSRMMLGFSPSLKISSASMVDVSAQPLQKPVEELLHYHESISNFKANLSMHVNQVLSNQRKIQEENLLRLEWNKFFKERKEFLELEKIMGQDQLQSWEYFLDREGALIEEHMEGIEQAVQWLEEFQELEIFDWTPMSTPQQWKNVNPDIIRNLLEDVANFHELLVEELIPQSLSWTGSISGEALFYVAGAIVGVILALPEMLETSKDILEWLWEVLKKEENSPQETQEEQRQDACEIYSIQDFVVYFRLIDDLHDSYEKIRAIRCVQDFLSQGPEELDQTASRWSQYAPIGLDAERWRVVLRHQEIQGDQMSAKDFLDIYFGLRLKKFNGGGCKRGDKRYRCLHGRSVESMYSERSLRAWNNRNQYYAKDVFKQSTQNHAWSYDSKGQNLSLAMYHSIKMLEEIGYGFDFTFYDNDQSKPRPFNVIHLLPGKNDYSSWLIAGMTQWFRDALVGRDEQILEKTIFSDVELRNLDPRYKNINSDSLHKLEGEMGITTNTSMKFFNAFDVVDLVELLKWNFQEHDWETEHEQNPDIFRYDPSYDDPPFQMLLRSDSGENLEQDSIVASMSEVLAPLPAMDERDFIFAFYSEQKSQKFHELYQWMAQEVFGYSILESKTDLILATSFEVFEQDTKRALVRLTKSPNSKSGFCTGFIVDDEINPYIELERNEVLIATNHHCAMLGLGGGANYAINMDKQVFIIESVAAHGQGDTRKDEHPDLTLLKAKHFSVSDEKLSKIPGLQFLDSEDEIEYQSELRVWVWEQSQSIIVEANPKWGRVRQYPAALGQKNVTSGLASTSTIGPFLGQSGNSGSLVTLGNKIAGIVHSGFFLKDVRKFSNSIMETNIHTVSEFFSLQVPAQELSIPEFLDMYRNSYLHEVFLSESDIDFSAVGEERIKLIDERYESAVEDAPHSVSSKLIYAIAVINTMSQFRQFVSGPALAYELPYLHKVINTLIEGLTNASRRSSYKNPTYLTLLLAQAHLFLSDHDSSKKYQACRFAKIAEDYRNDARGTIGEPFGPSRQILRECPESFLN